MTQCKDWCGLKYRDDRVPVEAFFASGATTAYCSQACLDAATAKPATSVAGERRLAVGWERVETWYVCTDLNGNDDPNKHSSRTAARYLNRKCAGIPGACEACAPSMGVFADAGIAAPPGVPLPKCMLCGREACSCTGTGAPIRPTRPAMVATCTSCAHSHVGPCTGRSPFGTEDCPCGHAANEKRATMYAVGDYYGDSPKGYALVAEHCRNYNEQMGHTATLLANLAREKPTRREIVVHARYGPGANLDES